MSSAMASRPQVGIDRLPMKKTANAERESMNCKSCRRRKIKCDRLKPSCEACTIFQCACVYDAVPKKRGPKTDANVLEALLKRFDGLEKKLQNGKGLPESSGDPSPPTKEPPLSTAVFPEERSNGNETHPPPFPIQLQLGSDEPHQVSSEIVETFFAKIHGKPHYILDEPSFRQNNQRRQLAPSQVLAIYATTIRYSRHALDRGTAMNMTEQYASQARSMLDIDEPSLESIQTLLLLSMAFYAVGKGKKAYMTLSNGIAMAYALNLHREVPMQSDLHPSEREMRRRLFWSLYIMDRFNSCGSKRPSIVTDKAILLKLPAFTPHSASFAVEGKAFNDGPNLQFTHDSVREDQGAIILLIDIARILGMTNRYLAGGGVAGDHHFPWHSGSTLSKIRNELSIWAASTQNNFASVETLFGHPDSTTLFLSKLIYHLTHVLLYRNFLPINLSELRGTGQHQSWQIEATNQCFLHANLMAELVELGRRDPVMEWPAFVGYCVLTAATVHVHGHHYPEQAGEIFAMSGQYLQKEYDQLRWLSTIWTGVQHQQATLETLVASHAQLVSVQTTDQIQFSPVYLEDFFDRYPGFSFECAHVSFKDVQNDSSSPAPHINPGSEMGRQQLAGQSSYSHDQTSSICTSDVNKQRPSLLHRKSSHSRTVQLPQDFDAGHQQHQYHDLMFPGDPAQFNHVLQSPDAIRPSSSLLPPGPHDATSQAPFSFSTSTPYASKAPKHNDVIDGAASPFTFPFSPVALEDLPSQPSTNILQQHNLPSQKSPYHPSIEGSHPQHHHPSQDPPDPMASTPHPHDAASQLTPASEGDPFLKLLEELAHNEQNQGGPSELDFFLNTIGTSDEAGTSVPG